MQKIEIKSKREAKDGCYFSEVYIDGKKLEGVRSYTLTHGAGGIPILKLDIKALDIAVDAEVLMYDQNSLQEMEIVWKDRWLENDGIHS